MKNKNLILRLGVKSDPIEYRYSFDWLFDLMAEEGIYNLQLGSFTELFFLSDSFFIKLKEKAGIRNISISSLFTSHRELGGFMHEDQEFVRVTKRNYKRLIEIAGIVGSPSAGSFMGGVLRDCLGYRAKGIKAYIEGMKEVMHLAKEHGLKWLTLEPMSCFAEPPCNGKELINIVSILMKYHEGYPEGTVKFGICGDISHGWANEEKEILENNYDYFISALPYMCEFHFKNTDGIYHETFGFEPENLGRGVVNVRSVQRILIDNRDKLPVVEIVGYLELPGPKIGRDYTDSQLGRMVKESLRHLKKEFLRNRIEQVDTI